MLQRKRGANLKKIFSIIVAYNSNTEELSALIRRLKQQTDTIIICNNTSNDLSIRDDNLIIFNFHKNIGIAKAQSFGMKWAFSNGADFVLQVDQDSVPDKSMVSQLLETYQILENKGYNVGLVGPQDYDIITNEIRIARLNKGKQIENSRIFLVDSTLSSGSLISKKAYEIVGGMMDDLFIDLVDYEFCWRLRKSDFIVAKDLKAKLSHRLGNGKKRILGFLCVGVPAPIRHYYAFRNTIFLLSKNYAPLYWKLSSIVKLIFKIIVYPIMLDNGKSRLNYMVLGLKHGIKGRMGRID